MILSFVAFAIGTGSLLTLDLFLSASLDDGALAEWAMLKSTVLLGGTFAAAGLDQALIRSAQGLNDVLVPAAMTVAVLAIPTAILAALSSRLQLPGLVYVGAVAFGLLLICAGAARAQLQVLRGIAIVHLWKPLVASAILLSYWRSGNSSARLILPLGLAVLAVVSLVAGVRNAPRIRIRPKAISELRKIGARFWILALSSAGFAYLDQLLLGVSADVDQASLYFKYIAIFTPAAIFATGFGANVITPFFRSRGNAVREMSRRLLLSFLASGVVIVTLSCVAGLVVGRVLGILGTPLDLKLMVTVLTISTLRYAYLLPSSFVGVFGTNKELTWLALGGAAMLPTLAMSYFVLGSLGIRPTLAAGLSVIFSLSLRILNAVAIAAQVLGSGRILEAVAGSARSVERNQPPNHSIEGNV